MATETKKVVFTGAQVDGYDGTADSHTIDLGVVAQGKDKGKARQRLSGSDVLSYLQGMVAAGRDHSEVVAALEGAKALAITGDDGPRNEAHDAAFAAFVDSLRANATKVFTRSELTKKAVSAVGGTLGWKGIDEITEGAEVLTEDFTRWMYEVSASDDGGGLFAKAVVKQKGQQQVSLKAR